MPRIRDRGRGRATPAASSNLDNPQDISYNPSLWTESFDSLGWYATANFDSGQANVPFTIFDDGNTADGNDVIVWTIDDNSSYGFANDTYIFT
jgi:hypothetical protein